MDLNNMDDEISLNFDLDKVEDRLFLRNRTRQLDTHKKKTLEIDYNTKKSTSNLQGKPSESFSKQTLALKGRQVTDDKYLKILMESFDTVHPLFYLSSEQRKILMNKIIIQQYERKTVLYSGMENDLDPGDWAAFILLEGEVHIFNNKLTFQDLIHNVTFFGYDGPIFLKRFSTVLVETGAVIAVITRPIFLEMLQPYSRFATFISRNIRYKDKVLDNIQSFKSYILSCIDNGPIEIAKMLELYKGIDSCLHPKCMSEELDITAWAYALNRLPQCVIETYIFVLINNPPRLLSLSDELAKDIMPKIITNARNRDVYKYLDGKNVIILRDMETDVLDFVSNMCIHIIESTKMRKYICSPITVNKIHQARGSFDETLDVIVSTTGLMISEDEAETLRSVFGSKFSEKLINLCLNYQDFCMTISKSSVSDRDPIENWTQNLWNVSKEILGVSSWMTEIDDLVVDIIQGSKKTLLNCISPHLYMHQNEILEWGTKIKLETKTKEFLNENDRLLAYSHYYYLAHPDKDRERKELYKTHGIEVIEKTFGTGVQVVVVNVNKLDKNYIDSSIKLKPKSKNHIILQIGYTFGNQSHEIIKPVLMLFGQKARSLNILGKAGGLVGNRSDIVVASKIFSDKTHDVVEVNYGELDLEDLRKSTNTQIHLGPMLTVAGTILQNSNLLTFYKHVMGCVGLEMEGYYFAREVENCIKHGLVNDDFITRCFYYVSDMPIDPFQNLAVEGLAVSWEEGIGSMNAIQRFILRKILSDN